MRNVSLLIKPTSSICNMDCEYCFYNDVGEHRQKKSMGIMTLETLEEIVKRAFEFSDSSVTFAFQGGEPTLVSLQFYKEFMTFVHKYNIHNLHTEFSIQTNGTLIDQQWVEFFKENNFLVGLSIDGMENIHDKYRVMKDGTTTYRRVAETLFLLRSYGVEHNILHVVTKQTVLNVEAIYNHFLKLGVEYLQIIPVLDPLYEGHDNYSYSLTKEELGSYLKQLFDLWYRDFIKGQGIRVLYFENIVTSLMKGAGVHCAMRGQCSIQLVVEANGAVYPCDFYVIDEWQLGNVDKDTIFSMLTSERANQFIKDSTVVNKTCSQCQWFTLCSGSCKRYQQSSKDNFESYYCESYKTFFQYASTRLKHLSVAFGQ